jgi:protein subunit release factor A
MVTPEVLVTAVLGVLGLAGTGAGFLYRRDDKHKEDLEAEIESNEEAIEELDTAFGRMAQRLFGHPEDETDTGALMTRAERVAAAEEDIDSLSDEVQYAKEAAEENGEHIEDLDERVTEHAHQTRAALERIEEQLDETLLPRDGSDDFLRGGGTGGDD